MAGSKIKKIVMIGAGNLATNLALALKKAGFSILQIYNRTPENGKHLAGKVSAKYIDDLKDIERQADLYIISVSDSAIKSIAAQIYLPGRLIIHTSGTTDLDVLKVASEYSGVFHSPQTFSRDKFTGFDNTPVTIQASDEKSEKMLFEFAKKLSNKVYKVSSEQRKIIHMAAVFASNFPNFMYTIAEELLHKNGLPFDLVLPIINKTSDNAGDKDPFKWQTGPAVREDYEVMDKHLELLAGYPDYQDIYKLISKSIIKYKKSDEQLQRTSEKH